MNLLTDPDHCGRCDSPCGADAQCLGGSCVGIVNLRAPEDFHGFVLTDGAYRLRWVDTNTDEETYLLEQRDPSESDFTLLAELPADATEFVDTAFIQSVGTIYRLRAEALELQGPAVSVDSSHKLWTYISILNFDSTAWDTWPPEENYENLISYRIPYRLEGYGDSENLDVVVLGDAYGDIGSIYAHARTYESDIFPQPELAMNDVNTYKDFFDWVVAEHPGQRYLVEYLGIGVGVAVQEGFLGFDDTSGSVGLSPAEVADVLRHLADSSGRPVDLFCICTPFNQMIESAYAMRGAVQYIVASEATGECGFPPLSVLGPEQDLSPRNLAIGAVDVNELTSDPESNFIVSAVDVDAAADVVAALDVLAVLLLDLLDADPQIADEIRTAAGEAQSMAVPNTSGTSGVFVDVYDLCAKIDTTLSNPDVHNACYEIVTLLTDSFVVRNLVFNPLGDYPDAHGISIYHPNPDYSTYWTGAVEGYKSLAFATDTQWDEYIFTLYPP
ncbi:MAG: clostripain-related cysteine peptidase [bacterium]